MLEYEELNSYYTARKSVSEDQYPPKPGMMLLIVFLINLQFIEVQFYSLPSPNKHSASVPNIINTNLGDSSWFQKSFTVLSGLPPWTEYFRKGTDWFITA